MRFIVLIALLMVFLLACDNTKYSGTIIDKEFDEGGYKWTYTYECGYGLAGYTCGKYDYKNVYVPDDYDFIVEDVNGETHRVDVNEETYYKYDIGMWWGDDTPTPSRTRR